MRHIAKAPDYFRRIYKNLTFFQFSRSARNKLIRSRLFKPVEINIMIRNLKKFHRAYNSLPSMNQETIALILWSSPVLLGIKPMSECDTRIAKEQLSVFSSFLSKFTHNELTYQFQPAFYDRSATCITIINQEAVLHRTISISDGKLLAEAVKTRGANTSTNFGLFFGYPEESVMGFANGKDNLEKASFSSCYFSYTIVDSSNDPLLVKKSLARFDLAIELVMEYLEIVKKKPLGNISAMAKDAEIVIQ